MMWGYAGVADNKWLTVLLASLAGWPESEARLADRAWPPMLACHNVVVTRAIARYRGREYTSRERVSPGPVILILAINASTRKATDREPGTP